ncbi:MAG: hypothetical protein CML13_05810 [Puniceicoccaceae bacterium]|nr:hypothetical protein [Puniceicoccaceae bacterium]|tara:strand:- start:13459 stop:14148 length:690 start_codon:yes stop_codon:yes gene_type:complete
MKKHQILSLTVLSLVGVVHSGIAQTLITNANEDIRIADEDENGVGNSTSSGLFLGDSSNENIVFGSAWRFDIRDAGEIAAINAAPSIFFEVDIFQINGQAQTVFPTVNFFALATPDSLSAADYNVGSNAFLGTIDMTGFSPDDTVQFDVTSIVKAATDHVGFIMQIQNPVDADGDDIATGNDESGVADYYIFYDVSSKGRLVSVIPEPGTYALFTGLFGLASVATRRRR